MHSWAHTPDTPTAPRLNPPVHSYVLHKTFFSESQFIRMCSNSYVCLPIHSCSNQKPIHSYSVQFIRTSSSKIFLNPNSFVCLPLPSYVFGKKSFWTPSHSYVVQVFRMSSTSFVCFPQKSFWTPIHSYVVQVFRMSSNSFVCLPKTNPEP
jgi:hypothetical protein